MSLRLHSCTRCTKRVGQIFCRAGVLAAVAALIGLTAPPARSAEPSDDSSVFAAQIATGEFASALAGAAKLPPGAERDQALRQIAVAQSQAGARQASISTIGGMTDDLSRADAIRGLDPIPAGRKGAFGGFEPDFSELMDLISSTIAPSSWDSAGGAGSLKDFPGGVYVDAEGMLRPALSVDRTGALESLRRATATGTENGPPVGGAHHKSSLRMVSLTRLERAVQLAAAAGRKPSDEMQVLAGLERIKYVWVFPETHDLVIAGPADDWQSDSEGRLVAKTSNHPVLRLDDLIVVLRHLRSSPDARFGCSITPTEEGLARTRAFAADSARTPLKPGHADEWLKKLREQLGRQKIDVYGLDPRTRAGRIMVEADYRMKLVGIGLEEGVLGVPSYLSQIELNKDGSTPPLDVLRWWFTLNYDAVQATPERDGFELRGQGVKVLSENELLTATGQQVHTGASNPLNDRFARDFTDHFRELAVKYPIYAELQNIFDMALVGALIRTEKLADRADWHLTCFGDPAQYAVELQSAPTSVESVLNHRVVNKTHILVGVSGGVSCDPNKLVQPDAIETDKGYLRVERSRSKPKAPSPEVWWWE